MREEEIEAIMERTIDELWSLSRDRRIFTTILSLAIRKGENRAQRETHLLTNQAFRGYNEVTLAN